MLQREKDATIDYLEFSIVQFINQFEKHLDPDQIGSFHSEAFAMLSDIDDTAQVLVDGSLSDSNTARR